MASVTVWGTSRMSVRPDRATLDLGLTHVAGTTAAALDEVAGRSQQLAAQLQGLGITDRQWSTQGISIAEEWVWKNDSNTMVGHRATSGVTVHVDDPDQVSTILRVAVDEAGAQVRNLQWSVAADNPARHALLGEAALDARRRAGAYVGALGLGLGAVEEISDLPIVTPSGGQAVGETMLRSAKMTEQGGPMHVNAGEIELAATVFVRFGTLDHL